MAHGLEARVPFLDRDVLDVVEKAPTSRTARANPPNSSRSGSSGGTDVPDQPYLPKAVLWRQKEQFSDGVGYSWIDGLKEHAARVISDDDMATAAIRFPYNTPTTKEGCYFRTTLHSHFPNNNYGNGIEGTIPGGPSACSTAKAIE